MKLVHGQRNVRTTQWFGRAEHCSHTMRAPPQLHCQSERSAAHELACTISEYKKYELEKL